MITVIVLCIVFILITFGKVFRIKLEMWQIMSLGALVDIIFGGVEIKEALRMIDWNIIFFLFCMFCVGVLFEISGYLNTFYSKIFSASSLEINLYILIFSSAFLSALLMNDTIAVVSVPLISYFSKKYSISPKPFIMTVAFSITIGSAMSPIGNPQNLLIAILGNMKEPFFLFLKYLFAPTIINLLLIYWFIKIRYKDEFKKAIKPSRIVFPVKKGYLYHLSKLTLAILFGMIGLKIYLSLNGKDLSLVSIAIVTAFPALFLSFKQIEIIKNVDWKTLLFFASMFIVTTSAWESGYIESFIRDYDFRSIKFIFISSAILSQFISNVPLVSLFIPIIKSCGGGEKELIALAAASTLAGNLTILGAASNVIIIQSLESRKIESVSPFEFFLLGLPFTVVNLLVYFVFF